MIDVVYTWVDGADPMWFQKKSARVKLAASNLNVCSKSGLSNSRFHNRDELKYSLRSLDMFTQFVRKIFIVTDDQVPVWLDTNHPKIQIVDHRDIFPIKSHLPTFNSHAIEANLHRIEGLSEKFIYLNDDVALSSDLIESDFFDDQDRMLVYFDHRKVQRFAWWFGYNAPVNAAARNNSRLLNSLSYDRIDFRLDHAPYVLRKSIYEELWELFPNELERTSGNPFRHPADLSTASSLVQHYALATNRAVKGPPNSSTYIKIKRFPFSAPLTALRLSGYKALSNKDKKFFSINDAGQLDNSRITQNAIANFLEHKFPFPSPFELRKHDAINTTLPIKGRNPTPVSITA